MRKGQEREKVSTSPFRFGRGVRTPLPSLLLRLQDRGSWRAGFAFGVGFLQRVVRAGQARSGPAGRQAAATCRSRPGPPQFGAVGGGGALRVLGWIGPADGSGEARGRRRRFSPCAPVCVCVNSCQKPLKGLLSCPSRGSLSLTARPQHRKEKRCQSGIKNAENCQVWVGDRGAGRAPGGRWAAAGCSSQCLLPLVTGTALAAVMVNSDQP